MDVEAGLCNAVGTWAELEEFARDRRREFARERERTVLDGLDALERAEVRCFGFGWDAEVDGAEDSAWERVFAVVQAEIKATHVRPHRKERKRKRGSVYHWLWCLHPLSTPVQQCIPLQVYDKTRAQANCENQTETRQEQNRTNDNP